MNINKIAVYCASATGFDAIYMEQAYALGQAIAQRNKALVYGGAHVGLMGAVANGTLDNGGEVHGVIPDFLKVKELEHKGITHCYVVTTMHERKAKMSELSDAFIALPGGFGTMEELFEMITWGQLALHKKPIGLVNIKGFYDPMLLFVEEMIERGFVKEEYRNLLIVDDNIDRLLDRMEEYAPLKNDKWFKPVK